MAEDLTAIPAHRFVANHPVVVADEAALATPEALLVRRSQRSAELSLPPSVWQGLRCIRILGGDWDVHRG